MQGLYELARRSRTSVYFYLGRILAYLINTLPDKLIVEIKTNSQMIRRMDYQRHDIWLNVESQTENELRLYSCQKEPETVEWIECLFTDGDVFYDVGANVGVYSLVASKFHGGKVTVYAFEPSFPNFAQLCKNIARNKCQGSIIPLQVALSEKTDFEDFNYHNLTAGGARHALGKAIDAKGDQFHPVLTHPVLACSIDDLVTRFRLPAPNHIKIDVDGIDLSVLRGASKTLEGPSVKSVLIEIEETARQVDQCTEFLQTKGLTFRSKRSSLSPSKAGPFSNSYNYIFSRRDI